MNDPPSQYALRPGRWAEVALDAIAEQGIKGAAIEPLARRLGVTKGSFYWHYPNREALLQATLALWERRETDEVLARASQERDPRKRLARLFREADGSKRAGRLYLALTNAAGSETVARVVHRVMEHRLDFLQRCYTDMEYTVEEARQRAVLAYSVFLGTLQLRRDADEVVPAGDAFSAYMDYVGEALIPGYCRSLLKDDVGVPPK